MTSFIGEPRAADFERLVRGSKRVGRACHSSLGHGLSVQRRLAPAEERREETLDNHYIVLWRDTMVADRAYRAGRFARVVKPRGTVSLGSAGLLPAVRPLSAYNIVACIIDQRMVGQAVVESNAKSVPPLHEHLGLEDSLLAGLVETAVHEAENGHASGRLFADSLAYVIVNRFIRLASVEPLREKPVAPLPARRLRKVLDRINDSLDENMSLADLADEAGFSRAHFLRMFKAATGTTPHQHLLETRLQAARERLSSTMLSITEIALACGFSSHSHFTRAFRERFGATPTGYRGKGSVLPSGTRPSRPKASQ
jgi:AraC family transcriptional regulator